MARKRGGCGSFFFGFLTGFLAFILLIGGGGLLAYHKLSIRTVEKVIGADIVVGNETFKNLPLKDLIALAGQIASDKGDITVDVLGEKYGITLPDELGGMNITRFKEVVGDCRITDFGSMINKVTAEMTLEEVLAMTGTTEMPSTVAALKSYTVDDILGKEGGKGLEGILSEVTVGELLNVTDEENTDRLLWMIRDYPLLGENGIQTLGEDLTLADLSAFGLSLDNNILRAMAEKQDRDVSGNPLFVGIEEERIVLDETGLHAVGEDAQPFDPSAYEILPLIEAGKQVERGGKKIFTDGTQELTYDAAKDVFLKADGTDFSETGAALRPKLLPLANLGSAVDEMTLGEVLGDPLPAPLGSFADTKVSELSSIRVEELPLSDLVPESMGEGDLLYDLAAMAKRTEITLAGVKTDAETYRKADTGEEVYLAAGKYYRRNGTDYEEITLDASEIAALEHVGYKVAELDLAVDELTISDFFGESADKGALSLLGGDVKLKEVPDAFSSAVTDSTLYKLLDAGLLGSVTRAQLGKTIGGKELGSYNIVEIVEFVAALPAS